MRALVTGGGGFLGRYIVDMLVARGDAVRILARGEYPELAALGVDCQRGDLREAATVARACAGMDVVFHVAAKAAFWGKPEDFAAINVGGTENVLAGCRAGGVERLVYTSTPSVVFGMDDLAGIDEAQPYPERYLAPYPETKARAERLVLAANGADLRTCALRPHCIWGPRDNHLLPMLIQRARAGQLVQVGNGTNKISICYVENGAAAHLAAADALGPGGPAAGQVYFVNDAEPVCLWPWVKTLLARLDLPPIERRIGYGTAKVLATAMEALWRWLPLAGEPRLTRFAAANFAKSHWFRIDKARRELAWQPHVDAETALARTVAWFKDRESESCP